MNWAADCVAVIPCLNEESRIASVIGGVRQHLPAILVVDDGSSDRTSSVARDSGAQVLSHPQSQGKGVALRSGWTWALNHDFKWALTLDGDGQHSPADIPAFFKCAEREHAALVVGNRMRNPRNMPLLRRLVNRWMSARLSGAAGQSLCDTQCGYRLMNLQAWSTTAITTQHFEIESEVLLAFAAAGHTIRFVPIRVIYSDEKSKIHPIRDTLRWLRWWRQARQRPRGAAVHGHSNSHL